MPSRFAISIAASDRAQREQPNRAVLVLQLGDHFVETRPTEFGEALADPSLSS